MTAGAAPFPGARSCAWDRWEKGEEAVVVDAGVDD
jgi:hypothetical protein